MKAENKKYILPIVLIIILGFVAYGNSLSGRFIWDDFYLIKENATIKNWPNIIGVFEENISAGFSVKYNFYRPLQMLTYMADYRLWKLNASGYHLTNILLHILVALAIFWLITVLFDDWLVALFTSALFVVHPIHTEAVAYISGRADSLAALFILLTIVFYLKNFHALTLLSYALALLSRENSLVLPFLLLLYHYVFMKKIEPKRFLPIAAIASLYILLRFTALEHLLSGISYSTNVFQRMPGFFIAITNYIKLLLLPLNLHMEYGEKIFHMGNPGAVVGMAILFASVAYAFMKRKGNKFISFSILWFFIALLPQANLYPLNAYMAEHWLYVPSIGFFLILARPLSILCRKEKVRFVSVISIAGLLTFYSHLTIKQNEYWREPIALYERTISYAPESSRVYIWLSTAYHDAGRDQEAVGILKKAIEIDPKCVKAYNNLAAAYSASGKEEEAIVLLKKAIGLEPNYVDAYYNLGNIYGGIGRKEEAVSALKKAIEIDPNYFKAYNDLGVVYTTLGETEKAIEELKKAVSINPNYAIAHKNLAWLYYGRKEYHLAVKHCDRALVLGYKVKPELITNLKPYRR